MSLGMSVGFMRKMEKLAPELKEILYSLLEEIERQREESVGKTEFNELKDIVKDLGIAQKDLAIAQKRTEKRVAELVEAQKQTEKKIEELAEAQKRTEEELKTLIKEHKKTREHLGGLSMGFGYFLEDQAYKKLPQLLEKDFGIKIKDELKRIYLKDGEDNPIEVNIFGHGEKEGKEVTIIGEAKAQLSRNDVNTFLKKKINRLDGLYKNVFKLLVTYMTSDPEVETYVKNKNIALYYSYNF